MDKIITYKTNYLMKFVLLFDGNGLKKSMYVICD